METESGPAATDLRAMLGEGGRIAAILLFWGALALVGFAGVPNIGFYRPRSFFWWIGNTLGWAFAVTGVANALVYAIVRGVRLSRR